MFMKKDLEGRKSLTFSIILILLRYTQLTFLMKIFIWCYLVIPGQQTIIKVISTKQSYGILF